MNKIPMPRGYDLEAVGKIRSEAQRSFRQEHIAAFGNFLGPEISRDMVRHVLMALKGVEADPLIAVKCTSGNCRGRRKGGNGNDVWIDSGSLPEYEAGTFRPVCNECS